jgi:predicted nucleotidyltransferase
MGNSLIENILIVCKILNKHSVEYLIVGGAAVALHGYYRRSYDSSGQVIEKHDLDFWYNPTYDNYFKLLNALEEIGQDVTKFRNESSPNPKKSFFKLESDKYTIDFLPEIPGLEKFRDSYNQRDVSQIDEIEISFINYNDLIINKEFLGRPKDIEDVKQLKSRRLNPE